MTWLKLMMLTLIVAACMSAMLLWTVEVAY